MTNLHAYGHHGPCINPRTVTLCETVDPFGINEYQNFFMECEIFDALKFESQCMTKSKDVSIKDVLIKEGGQYCDAGKFGSCIKESIREAERTLEQLKGANLTIQVVATLVTQPAMYAKKEPFYYGDTMIHHLLPRWGVVWENNERTEPYDFSTTRTDFVVWENGEYTDEWETVQTMIEELPKQDIAQDCRKQSGIR